MLVRIGCHTIIEYVEGVLNFEYLRSAVSTGYLPGQGYCRLQRLRTALEVARPYLMTLVLALLLSMFSSVAFRPSPKWRPPPVCVPIESAFFFFYYYHLSSLIISFNLFMFCSSFAVLIIIK